jgi:hypothetical protein
VAATLGDCSPKQASPSGQLSALPAVLYSYRRYNTACCADLALPILCRCCRDEATASVGLEASSDLRSTYLVRQVGDADA